MILGLLGLLALSANLAVAQSEIALSLVDVLKRVDEQDPTLRVTALQRLQAEIDLRRANWNRVNGNLGFLGQETANKGFAPTTGYPQGSTDFYQYPNVTVQGQINFPLYAGGQISEGIRSAEARLEAQSYNFEQVRRDLRRAALIAYAQILSALQQEHIAQHALERNEELVALAEKRRLAGVGTDAEVARAKLTRLREQEELEQRIGDRRIAQAYLAASLLLPSGTVVVPNDSLEMVAHYNGASHLAERAEMLVLRSQLTAAAADRRVAFSNYLPKLSLFANAAYGNQPIFYLGGLPTTLGGNATSANPFGYFVGNVGAGATLSWTAFDFFVTRDQVAKARAAEAQAEARLIDEQRQVTREQAEARAREEAASKRVQALAGGSEAAALTVKLARVRFESGNATLTEVLDAEIEAIGVESRQVQAAYDQASSHLDLLRAEGELL